MKVQYVCTEKACAEKIGMPFMMEFPSEVLMDEKNIAAIFCRHCGATLVLAQQQSEQNGKQDKNCSARK